MTPLINTIVDRPYVVAFLVTFLILSIPLIGLKRTLIYMGAGYTIAFISEYLSINYGFPYGWYFYKYENLARDWMNHGVPVWDSASYIFMCFSGFYAAHFVLSSRDFSITKNRWILVITSAIFTTLLDVIIDPVSHLGARWFLGEIYYYPNPGFYFDITMANFGGWFLVSFLINGFGIWGLKIDQKLRVSTLTHLFGLGLYFGIFGFGIGVAVYLQEWMLVVCDLAWLGLILSVIMMPKKKKRPETH